MRPVDLTGRRFGRLIVLELAAVKNGNKIWHCRCDCLKDKVIRHGDLQSGRTQSCGCLRNETTTIKNTKHGANVRDRTHPLYSIWKNIKTRCNNPNTEFFGRYGGRGIRIYNQWNTSFVAFREYVLSLADCPSNAQIPGAKLERKIDRIDNNGHYEPGNIKWSTQREQMNNMSANRLVTINKTQLTLSEAVNKYAKVPYSVVLWRLDAGWSMKDAFLKPSRKKALQ